MPIQKTRNKEIIHMNKHQQENSEQISKTYKMKFESVEIRVEHSNGQELSHYDNSLTLNQITALAISINCVLLLEAMRTKTPSSRINLRDTWYKSLFPYPPTSATTNFFIFLFNASIQGCCFLQ